MASRENVGRNCWEARRRSPSLFDLLLRSRSAPNSFPSRSSLVVTVSTKLHTHLQNMGQDSLILPPISLPSCPVNLHTLPIELLAYIFLFCTKVLKDPTLPYPAWLPITHVCRHWRTVALTHAKLWTSIDPGLSSQWVKVFMERSQTMLMDFDLHISPYDPVHQTKIGFYHSHNNVIQLLSDFTRLHSLHLKRDSQYHRPHP